MSRRRQSADLVTSISEAIFKVNDVVPIRYHDEVRRMYNWGSVAERTEKVGAPPRRLREWPHGRLGEAKGTTGWMGHAVSRRCILR